LKNIVIEFSLRVYARAGVRLLTPNRRNDMQTLHRISAIPQLGGGMRYHLTRCASDADEARQAIRSDPALIECHRGEYVVDRDGDGEWVCREWPGPADKPLSAADWQAIKAAIEA
jgi:hypothetical protein